jgi:hypothetical protein
VITYPDGSKKTVTADKYGDYTLPASTTPQEAGNIAVTASIAGDTGTASASKYFQPKASIVNATTGSYFWTYNNLGQAVLSIKATPNSIVTMPYTGSNGQKYTQVVHIGPSGLGSLAVTHEMPEYTQVVITDDAQGAKASMFGMYVPQSTVDNISQDSARVTNPGNNKPLVTISVMPIVNNGSGNSTHAALNVGAHLKATFPDGSSVTTVVTAADIADGTVTFPGAASPQDPGTINVSMINGNSQTNVGLTWNPEVRVDHPTLTQPKNNKPAVNITGLIPGTTISVKFPSGEVGQEVVPADGSVTIQSNVAQPSGNVSITDSMGTKISGAVVLPFQPLYVPGGDTGGSTGGGTGGGTGGSTAGGGAGGDAGHQTNKQSISVTNNGNNVPVAPYGPSAVRDRWLISTNTCDL